MAKRRASLKMPEEKKERCLAMLRQGKLSKREIANKLKINAGYVYKMAYEENVGQWKNEIDKVEELEGEKEMEKPEMKNLQNAVDVFGESPEENKDVENLDTNNEEDENMATATTRRRVSDDIKLQVAEDLESGMLGKEAAQKYGISQSTVSKISKELDVNRPKIVRPMRINSKINNSGKEEASTIVPLTNADTVEIFKGAHVICGLIAERHDIPCEEFIFSEAIPSNMMHNYDYQYKQCMEFIKNHITFSKSTYKLNSEETILASADIICYMTGCQSVLGALVKACFESRVNLTLMHYDTDIREYHPQVIFSHFRDENALHTISYLDKFLDQYKKGFMYKCTENELRALDEFYVIDRVHIGTNTTYDKFTKKGATKYAYICKSDADAWELYPKLAKEIIADKSENMCLYMIHITQEEDKWTYGYAFAKTYNFKTEKPEYRK